MATPITPLDALFASAKSSGSVSSSSPTGVYRTALSNFVAMQTRILRKPYSSPSSRYAVIEDARVTGTSMMEIYTTVQPNVKIHVTPEYILLEFTGTIDWIDAASALAKSRGWKKNRDITISETVTVRPYITKTEYEEPNLNRGSNYQQPSHGPTAYKHSWMNLPIQQQMDIPLGGVTRAARQHKVPLHNMARYSSLSRSTRGRGRAYTEELAYKRGLADATAAMEEAVSNVATTGGMGGGKRKTRKARK